MIMKKDKQQNPQAIKHTMSVQAKLLIPILALIVAGLFTCVVSMNRLSAVQSASEIVSGTSMSSIEKLSNVDSGFQALQKLIFAYCLNDNVDTRTHIEGDTQTAIDNIEAANDELSSYIVGDDAKAAYETFDTDFSTFMDLYNQAFELATSGDIAGAAAIANDDMTMAGVAVETDINSLTDILYSQTDATVADQHSTYATANKVMIVMIIVLVFLFVIIFIICQTKLILPIKHSTKDVNHIVDSLKSGHCDLGFRIPIKGTDEISQLCDGINLFVGTLEEIMGQLTHNSDKMDVLVSNIVNSVDASNTSACDISAVMEELSATMEEVSSSMTTVTENASAAGGDVSQIASAAEEILAYATDMNHRAIELRDNAEKNKSETTSVIEQIGSSLKEAIENSSSVSKVQSLTDDILSISSQTNLLALNASIEAARAGEAGKGFAVVADEIRQLADSSRETANNIQNINAMVVEAVEGLIKSSNEIVRYIDETVLLDYDNFVQSGEQYSNDSTYLNDKMNDFTKNTEHLNTIIASMVESYQEISHAVDESANAIANAAENTTVLVDDINTIHDDVSVNKEISDSFKDTTSKFHSSNAEPDAPHFEEIDSEPSESDPEEL